MPFLPISQVEYVTYTRYLEDIKVVEQCCRKQQLSRMGFLNDRFVKVDDHQTTVNASKTLSEKLSSTELNALKNRIKFINTIHHKLEQGKLKERNGDDCAPLAAEYYNTHFKTISAWNKAFVEKEMHIDLPNAGSTQLDPSFTEKTMAEMADEKALTRYFELLKLYPKLKRDNDLNDYTKGVYQIIYDAQAISMVRKEVYQRLYNKAKTQNLSHREADELATNFSRPGVVCEDQFWLWIRDVVISPQGYRHTYNRIVWKCDLEKIGGAAALPILIEDKNKKIVIQLIFRHATNSWEFEMPRGGSKPNETPVDTAKREVLEETGYVTDNLVYLGSITPDSGLTASIVPIYLGQVTVEKESKHDKTEAIKGRYAFTPDELKEGLKRGYMEVEINHQLTKVPLRDPFLTYAILMAQYHLYL